MADKLLLGISTWRHQPEIVTSDQSIGPDTVATMDPPGVLWAMVAWTGKEDKIAAKLEQDVYDLHREGDEPANLKPGQVLITEPEKVRLDGVPQWICYMATR